MAGVSAGVEGPFTGLRTQGTVTAGGTLKLNNFLRPASTAQLGMEDAAGFSLGGQARLQGSASFKADIGSAEALKAKIEFDGEVVTQVEAPPQPSQASQQQSGEQPSPQQKADCWQQQQATFWRRQQRLQAD
jgi:hypothetical protein